MKKTVMLLPLVILLFLTGCAQKLDGDDMMRSYTLISQDTAKEMMARDDGHIILDVRRQDEYDAGHIPGAILIPNESIGTERPEELPDPDQIILIYCRSGNRSKQAAQKLFDMGYTNIYEFGGIIDWTGEIVTEGTETMNTKNPDYMIDAIRPTPMLVIEANGRRFYAVVEDNPSAEAFTEKLSSGAVELDMSDYGGFEKVGSLPWQLPRSDETFTTVPGDVILYQGDRLTIYYDENTWDFTRLARIASVTKEELLSALGEGDVTVKLWVEWSE